MHARTRSDHVRIDCFAVSIDVANPLAEHIRHRLGVGRGLHHDRRRGRNGRLAGREGGHRPDCNCSGGHLRARRLLRGRLLGLGDPYLRERQRRNHCANKNNRCWSHGFPFIALTLPGCFATCVPFGCLHSPCSKTLLGHRGTESPCALVNTHYRCTHYRWLTQRRKLRQQQGGILPPAVLAGADKITRNACKSRRIHKEPCGFELIDDGDFSLPLGRAQLHGCRPCRCNRHAPFGRSAAAL